MLECFVMRRVFTNDIPPNAPFIGVNMSMFYDWSKIEGFQCPVKIVISRRGLGKTFGKVKKAVEDFITKKHRFIYVVETDEMISELTKNNGEKFWCSIIDYYSEQNTSRKRYFYNNLTELSVNEEDTENGIPTEIYKRKSNAKLVGGIIKVKGDTAGYIVSLNSYGEIKRNNFIDVHTIIVDEFISEKMDKTTLENPRKISSIIQSILRLKKAKVYLLGNSVRLDDPILSRMGFKIDNYGFYRKYDNSGLFAVLHFVDPADYPEFAEAHKKSVAGRFASMLKETNEEENKFLCNIPTNRRLVNFKYRKGGLRLNVIKGDIIVSIKELVDGGYAVVPFSRIGDTTLLCLSAKEQGFKMGYHIIYNKVLKETLTGMMAANALYYYSEIEYVQLKEIIKGD